MHMPYMLLLRITRLRSPLLYYIPWAANTDNYTLALHDALPIWPDSGRRRAEPGRTYPPHTASDLRALCDLRVPSGPKTQRNRSEEHTSELQSRGHLVCRLLLEKKKRKKKKKTKNNHHNNNKHIK